MYINKVTRRFQDHPLIFMLLVAHFSPLSTCTKTACSPNHTILWIFAEPSWKQLGAPLSATACPILFLSFDYMLQVEYWSCITLPFFYFILFFLLPIVHPWRLCSNSILPPSFSATEDTLLLFSGTALCRHTHIQTHTQNRYTHRAIHSQRHIEHP